MDTPGCSVEDTGDACVSDSSLEERVGSEGTEDVVGNLGIGGRATAMDETEVGVRGERWDVEKCQP